MKENSFRKEISKANRQRNIIQTAIRPWKRSKQIVAHQWARLTRVHICSFKTSLSSHGNSSIYTRINSIYYVFHIYNNSITIQNLTHTEKPCSSSSRNVDQPRANALSNTELLNHKISRPLSPHGTISWPMLWWPTCCCWSTWSALMTRDWATNWLSCYHTFLQHTNKAWLRH